MLNTFKVLVASSCIVVVCHYLRWASVRPTSTACASKRRNCSGALTETDSIQSSQTARAARVDDTKSSMTCMTWLHYAGYILWINMMYTVHRLFDRRQESLQRIQKKPRAQVENKKVFTQQPFKNLFETVSETKFVSNAQGLPTMLALMNRKSMTRGWR